MQEVSSVAARAQRWGRREYNIYIYDAPDESRLRQRQSSRLLGKAVVKKKHTEVAPY